jgi:hypothetical protein
MILELTLFDPSIALSESVVEKIQEILELSAPLTLTLDLGASVSLLVQQALPGGGDRKLEAMPIDEDGNFLFGTSVIEVDITVDPATSAAVSGKMSLFAIFLAVACFFS